MQRHIQTMRHDALGVVEALPVDVGGRFAFQACFDFVTPTVSTEQARRDFEFRAYSKLARARSPSPETALIAQDLGQVAFPVAPEQYDISARRLSEARLLLGLALRDVEETPSSEDDVTHCGASDFPGAFPEDRDGRSPQDAEPYLDEPLPVPTDERPTPGNK